MKSFTDNAGRSWTVVLNVTALKHVRDLCEVDLMDAAHGNLLERLITDPVLLCDVIYCICKEEADKAGITDEQFGQSMAGDAIEAATKALLEELIDFFPEARRGLLSKALGKMRRWEDLAIQAGHARLDAQETEDAFQDALNELGVSFTSSPES